jgi:hypothetical protein
MKLLVLTLFISFNLFAQRAIVKFNKDISTQELSHFKDKFKLKTAVRFHSKAPFSRYIIIEKDQLDIKVISKSSYTMIETIEYSASVDDQSINPQNTQSMNANLLFNHQWYLEANKQIITSDIDDINAEEFIATQEFDIDFKNIEKNIDTNEYIISVIDHGVDTEHPDLKDHIYKNLKECSKFGRVRYKAQDDLDGNGYIGDCNGIDFSQNVETGNPIVKDTNGHGTHVAGIIAAKNNTIGIQGIANNAKILPVKVFPSKKDNTSASSTVDRIAKAIIYSADMNSSVINLSLGWPRSMDNTLVREAVKYAQDKGAIIVAAAGNNSNIATISPCNYKNVICVGATNPIGKWTNFSNYGSNVDILAPGEQILSTFPTTLVSNVFAIKGYDIKNGTSQSAPIISGVLSYLKGIAPDATNNELVAHLYSSSKGLGAQEKFSAFDLVQISKGSTLKANVFKPQLKEHETLLVSDNKFKIKFNLKSFSKLDQDVSISISTTNNNIILTNIVKDINIEFSQKKELTFTGQVISLDKDNRFEFQIKISSANFSKTFRSIVNLVNATPLEVKHELPASLNLNSVLSLNDPLKLFADTTYLSLRYMKDDKVLLISKLNKKLHKIEVSHTKKFENVEKLIGIKKTDANYDGVEDYQIKFLTTLNDQKVIKIYHLDKEFNNLYPSVPYLIYIPEGAISKDPGHLKMSLNGAHYASEVFVAVGTIPTVQFSPNVFDFQSNKKDLRIYQLIPKKLEGIWYLKTKMLNDKSFNQDIKAYGYSELSNIIYLKMANMNGSDYYKSKIRILSLFDDINSKDVRFVTLSPNKVEVSNVLNYKANMSMYFTSSFNLQGHLQYNTDLIGLYSQKSYMLKAYNDDGAILKYVGKNKRDSVIGHIATYKQNDQYNVFFQTKSKLKMMTNDGIYTIPVKRFSFLPGTLMSDVFYPITINNNGEKSPAIYLDGTSISDNYISVITKGKSLLISPIKYSIHIPKTCRALNPAYNSKDMKYKYILLCDINKIKSWIEIAL